MRKRSSFGCAYHHPIDLEAAWVSLHISDACHTQASEIKAQSMSKYGDEKSHFVPSRITIDFQQKNRMFMVTATSFKAWCFNPSSKSQ
jgi:hypothetical protein